MRRLPIALLAAALSVFAGAALTAQSNDLVDEIIAQKQVQFGHAAYLALAAGGKVPETATVEEAATYALDQKWGLPKLEPASLLTLDQYSLILMKALDLPGGIGWSLFGGTRYALRELTFLKVAARPNWPEKAVSGDDAMRMLLKAMELKEAAK